jgi:homoserine dehydrogenase
MINIAIMGYGVVGSGIARVLEQNRAHIEKKAGQGITVKRVLDIRDFPGDPVEPLLTKDIDDILGDAEIDIVAEVMGGVDPAYDYVKRALQSGKSVCTSNKELVVKHGAELLALARKKELNFMFEASVGGGIPIVRPLNLALTTDEVVSVAGILNGTSNYILTQIAEKGMTYADALKEAQTLGYAEKDPKNDVTGLDACRKLAILLSLSVGMQVDYEAGLTKGITNITPADFAFARELGYTVKPMVDGLIRENGVRVMSVPFLIPLSHPFSTVAESYNVVSVQAKMTGNVMFYGRGAGQLPTAGAVISDIVDVAKHLKRHIMHTWSEEKAAVLPRTEYVTRKFIRVSCENVKRVKTAVCERQGEGIAFVELPAYKGQIAWMTAPESERMTKHRVAALTDTKGLKEIENVLRVYDAAAGPA